MIILPEVEVLCHVRLRRADPSFRGRQRAIARAGDLLQLVALDVAQLPGGLLLRGQTSEDSVEPAQVCTQVGRGARIGESLQGCVWHMLVEAEHPEKASPPK